MAPRWRPTIGRPARRRRYDPEADPLVAELRALPARLERLLAQERAASPRPGPAEAGGWPGDAGVWQGEHGMDDAAEAGSDA